VLGQILCNGPVKMVTSLPKTKVLEKKGARVKLLNKKH
jgi:hypothetical protein